jgi:general secretion pathway protein J
MTAIAQNRRSGGFTLLELLVALVVLGLLIVGLSHGVRTGLTLWTAQARQMSGTAELDSTARTVRRLLSGIPIAPVAAATGDVTLPAILFTGAAEHVSFVGDLPTGMGTTRRADITLALRGERLVLIWTPHRHEPAGIAPPPNEVELLRGVARLDLAYWGSASPEGPSSWLAQWEARAMPQLVRVRLAFPTGDRRHWPDLIVAPSLSQAS